MPSSLFSSLTGCIFHISSLYFEIACKRNVHPDLNMMYGPLYTYSIDGGIYNFTVEVCVGPLMLTSSFYAIFLTCNVKAIFSLEPCIK